MSAFSLQDFQANPGKYRAFKTAIIATSELPNFLQDHHVKIEYLSDVYDGMICKARIPVYKVTGIEGNTGYLYANALKGFVL